MQKIIKGDVKKGDCVKKGDYVKRGSRNRRVGSEFEVRVWHERMSKGYVCTKWHNNVDLEKGKLIIAKPGRFRSLGTGFPDYLSYKLGENVTEMIGIECKSGRGIDKIEKAKCAWLLEHGIFTKIYIAKKVKIKNRIMIEYVQIKTKDNDDVAKPGTQDL